jgi:hypothetical protein
MSWRRIEGFRQYTFVAILVFVMLSASQGYASVLQYGDKDVLGTATYSSEPTAGATLEGLTINQVTTASLITDHVYPFGPSVDYAGTDQIYVGSTQTINHDGYSGYAWRLNGPQVISMNYGSAIPTGHIVTTLTLGIAADDFQNPAFGQSFSASVNGVSNATLTSKLNSLDQTGPKVQFFSIGIDPDDLETNDILTLSVNQGGTGGDGWAIDFLTIGLTTEVPEPATICLLGIGGLLLRRRKSAV